jgi:hypothetical protein
MKLIYLSYIALAVIITSCCKGSFSTSTSIVNNTKFSITFIPYYNGELLKSSRNDLKSGEKINSGFPCLTDYCYFNGQKVDSLIVSFDDKYKVSHYSLYDSISTKGIIYKSKRNLFNVNSFNIERTKVTKCSELTSFIYTFTEQDYLDAKAKHNSLSKYY